MASKKKAKKSKKTARKAVKASKKAAKKTAKKPAKKTAKKSAKKPTKKKAPARKPAKKAPARKAAAKKPAKKAPARKKQIVGEGDYAATRAFDKAQVGFVKKNKARIPAMGKAAEAALEGPEGASLRAAEAAARAHSKAGPGEATVDAAEAEGLDRNAN